MIQKGLALIPRWRDGTVYQWRRSMGESGRSIALLLAFFSFQLRSAGRNHAENWSATGAGQYFTPRALIQAAVGAMASLFGRWGRRRPARRMFGA
jgi:hypothetical protein